MMNTDSLVGDAVLKGRVIGKITAKRTLEIFSTATIKGTFTAGRLIIPPANYFRWPEPLRIDGAEISGELVANIQATGTVVLKASGRLFGDVVAGNLVVESGAIFVGQARVGGVKVEAPETDQRTTTPTATSIEKKVVRRRTPASALLERKAREET